MWYKCLSGTQSDWCKNNSRDICWLLGVTRPGMRTDDVDMQLVWRWQGEGKYLLDNSWQPTTEKSLNNRLRHFENDKRSLDLQLQIWIIGKVKSFQSDKHCRQINWTEKGCKKAYDSIKPGGKEKTLLSVFLPKLWMALKGCCKRGEKQKVHCSHHQHCQ